VRKWCEDNPLKVIHKRLKERAKARNQEVLSLEELAIFLEGTDYIDNRGCLPHNKHIDRIDYTKGYVSGNLQILTAHDNCVKGNMEKVLLHNERQGIQELFSVDDWFQYSGPINEKRQMNNEPQGDNPF
jgi:hypothetical protein